MIDTLEFIKIPRVLKRDLLIDNTTVYSLENDVNYFSAHVQGPAYGAHDEELSQVAQLFATAPKMLMLLARLYEGADLNHDELEDIHDTLVEAGVRL